MVRAQTLSSRFLGPRRVRTGGSTEEEEQMNNLQVIQTSIVAVLIIAVPGVVAAQATTCSSCADCETKLNGGLYRTVYLAADIASHTGTCIWVNSQSDVAFDCIDHTIDGDGIGTDYGIAMLWGTDNEIRNCTVTDFETGILLWGTTNHLVVNNSTSSNTFGIWIALDASSNTLQENWSFDNTTGIRITDSNNNAVDSNDSCSNSFADIDVSETSSGNTSDGNRCETVYGWARCSRLCSRPTLEQLFGCRDMSRVGAALMSWLTDQVSKNGSLVKALNATYDLSSLNVISVGEVSNMLQPTYWPEDEPIPAVDPWGSPYEYRLASNILASRVLSVRARGSDLRFEGPVYTLRLIPTESNDLVWADGYWVGWPSADCSSFLFGDGFDSGGTTMWTFTSP